MIRHRVQAQFRIIEKFEGLWEDAGTRLMILPSILFVVSAEQISNMEKLIDQTEGAGAGADEIPEEDRLLEEE